MRYDFNFGEVLLVALLCFIAGLASGVVFPESWVPQNSGDVAAWVQAMLIGLTVAVALVTYFSDRWRRAREFADSELVAAEMLVAPLNNLCDKCADAVGWIERRRELESSTPKPSATQEALLEHQRRKGVIDTEVAKICDELASLHRGMPVQDLAELTHDLKGSFRTKDAPRFLEALSHASRLRQRLLNAGRENWTATGLVSENFEGALNACGRACNRAIKTAAIIRKRHASDYQ